MTNNITKL